MVCYFHPLIIIQHELEKFTKILQENLILNMQNQNLIYSRKWKKNCIINKKKEKYEILVSKNSFKINIDLVLIGEKYKRHYVLIKDFSTLKISVLLKMSGLALCAYFQHHFSIKIFHIYYSIDWQSSSSKFNLFSFSRYQTKLVIKVLFRQLLTT